MDFVNTFLDPFPACCIVDSSCHSGYAFVVCGVIISELPVVVVCSWGHISVASLSWILLSVVVDMNVISPVWLPSWPLGFHIGQPANFGLLVPKWLYLYLGCHCRNLESLLLLLLVLDKLFGLLLQLPPGKSWPNDLSLKLLSVCNSVLHHILD